MGSVLGVQSRESPSPSGTTTCTTLHTPELRESIPDPSESATRTVLHPAEIPQSSLAAPGPAARRALNTLEILEKILLEMDMRTLLTSGQRVCHTWTNLIRTSRSIQRTLFFIPIKESEWASSERTLNPLLAETFAGIFPVENDQRNRFFLDNLPMTKDPESMAIFGRLHASWRRMLVRQPPLADIGLLHIRSALGGDGVERSSIPADIHVGLRMETLFEHVLFHDGGRLGRRRIKRVYWSTEEPISFHGRTPRISDKFHGMISKFGVVVYSSEVVQCCMGANGRRTLGPSELVRKVIAVYERLSPDGVSIVWESDPEDSDEDSLDWENDSEVSDNGSDESVSDSH